MLPILRLFIKDLKDDAVAQAMKRTATSDEDTVFYGAPALVLVVSDRKDHWAAVNCALAAENMMLAAHSLGIGSCFIGRGDVIGRCKGLLQKIGMEEGYKVHASVIFGYAKDQPKTVPHRKTDNILSWK
jgi:Nitroreductase